MTPGLSPLCVVLVSPRNPLNIGAAARAMSNFGFFDLRLVNAYEVAFRDAKSAVNASKVLEAAREYPTLAEAVADRTLVVGTTAIGNRALEHPLRRLELGGRLIVRKMKTAPVALLFGSEKFGLSNDDMSHCHWMMRIPTRDAHASMNLGQAVALCLYELIRSNSVTEKPVAKALVKVGSEVSAKRPAESEDIERLTTLLLETLAESGYLKNGTGESANLKVRRLMRRMNLNAQDARMWLGILRQIQWKVRH
ncbi:MAG: TrmJ/YjtD family RNA methyltransferase [Acidobacteriota bacterium]